MKYGFTGTRHGLTAEQLHCLQDVAIDMTKGSHGACFGADREFHGLFPAIPMEIYPSDEGQHQWAVATCKGAKDVIHPIMLPIPRNHQIVNTVERMVAAPLGHIEQFRGSGTWATIRYARKLRRPLIILWPGGRVSREFM